MICQMLLTVELLTCLVVPTNYGWTSHYAPNVMAQVIENRQEWGHIPHDLSHFDGFVAVPECDRIGETIYAKPAHWKTWETFLVADCARPIGTDGAYEWMTENNILIEVDWTTAVRWSAVGGGMEIEVSEIQDS